MPQTSSQTLSLTRSLKNNSGRSVSASCSIVSVSCPQIRLGLLNTKYCHLVRMVINGHLTWTCQNASGNHGDDFRALKLCEMQPYTWLHPNKETAVYSVLGLQGEEKSGKRGMKTVGVFYIYSCTILPR